MVGVPDPLGRECAVPESIADDLPSFRAEDIEGIRSHLDGEGYVVVRGVCDPSSCERLMAAFVREVKPFNGWVYRQTTGRPERHSFDDRGVVMNPLIDLATMSQRRCGGFLAAAWRVMSGPEFLQLIGELLGAPPMVIQTFYFEGNPVTAPHHDGYYMDRRLLSPLLGAWIALEDIAPRAGRFFVCPGSHRLELPANEGPFEIGAHHDDYRAAILGVMAEHDLRCVAPALSRGDVLLWQSGTIHGSLVTTDASSTRSSLNAHLLPCDAPIAPVSRRRLFNDTFRPADFRVWDNIQVRRPVGMTRLRHHLPTLTRSVLAEGRQARRR